jgi:hypothetical protein
LKSKERPLIPRLAFEAGRRRLASFPILTPDGTASIREDALGATTGPNTYQAVEIKAGETVVSDYFKGLEYWREHLAKLEVHSWVVHGGSTRQQRTRGMVLALNGLTPLLKRVAGEA